MKKVAWMLGGCSLVAAVIIAGFILMTRQDKAAEPGSWVLLSGGKYQVVAEGKPLIYLDEAYLDSGDRTVISRPVDFSELKFYEVSPENILKPLNPGRFSISIEDEDALHTLQIASFKISGKTVLLPADLAALMGASHQIASSLDGKKHVVWNRGGMWLLEEGNLEEARKISSATHNNKSRRQLEIELTKLMQAEGIDTEWEMIEWNYNPRFSPDGTKIVYSTNRDFDAHNSTSLWIYDLKTNTEKRLFYKDGYHYGALTWLNDGQLLVGESGPILPTETGYYSETAYYLVDVHGNKRELIVPEGIGFQAILPSGVVAYVSYNFEMEGAHLMAVATAIGIGTIDPKTLTIVPKGVERALPAEAAPATFKKVSLNPSGTKLAYSYSETRGSRYGYNILKMVDIIRNKDLEIDLEHAGIDPWELHGHTLRWLSDDQILIHTGRGGRYFDASVNMYVQTLVFSTWLYKLGQ